MSDRDMWRNALETFRVVVKAHRDMPGMKIEDAMGSTTNEQLEKEYAFLRQQQLRIERIEDRLADMERDDKRRRIGDDD